MTFISWGFHSNRTR